MKKIDWNSLTEAEIMKMLEKITPLADEVVTVAEKRQMSLAKPPGSLGKLEEISVQMAGITGKVMNKPEKYCIAIMSADNGVVAEGVASAPQSVTMAQTINFTRRLTGVGALAKHFGVDLLVMDMGINGDVPAELVDSELLEKTAGSGNDAYGVLDRVTGKIVDRKLGRGTRNLAKEPAMSREQAVRGIAAGLEAAAAVSEAGYDLLGIGEMGIGNTTTSAAVLSALTGVPADKTVGKGGGITEESFQRKRAIVDEAIARNRFGMEPLDKIDVIDILAKVGGFDIAAMTGAFLGAAIYKVPVVIDGYISAVAALAAARLSPLAAAYMFPSHESWELGYGIAMRELGLSPMLGLNMRLGEGSGCPITFKIIEGACAVMNGMATFAEAEINDDYLEEIREHAENCF